MGRKNAPPPLLAAIDFRSVISTGRRTKLLFLSLVLYVSTCFAFSAATRSASYQTALQIRELTVLPRLTQTWTSTPATTATTRHFSVKVRAIYSLGQPRSGSTFQFVLLCIIAHLRSDSVSCAGEPASLQVIKMHRTTTALTLNDSSMLFTTVRDGDTWERSNIVWEGDLCRTHKTTLISRAALSVRFTHTQKYST